MTRKEWTLADDEVGCIIRLTLTGRTTGQTALSCTLDSNPASLIDAAHTRIEVRRTEDNSVVVGGPLTIFQSDPIILSPGSWRLRLQAMGGEKKYTWELPLTLKEMTE